MLTCDFGIFEKIITPAIRLLTAPPDFMTPEFANFSIIVLLPSIHPTRIPRVVKVAGSSIVMLITGLTMWCVSEIMKFLNKNSVKSTFY